MVNYTLKIPPAHSRLRGVLYELNCIANEEYDSQGDWVVDVRMPTADWNRLEKRLENGISEYVVRH
jgi:GTP-binding protein HflX